MPTKTALTAALACFFVRPSWLATWSNSSDLFITPSGQSICTSAASFTASRCEERREGPARRPAKRSAARGPGLLGLAPEHLLPRRPRVWVGAGGQRGGDAPALVGALVLAELGLALEARDAQLEPDDAAQYPLPVAL